MVFLDLDIVIVGSIYPLLFNNLPFAMLRGFNDTDNRNSSVMTWKSGELTELYNAAKELFTTKFLLEHNKESDQEFIREHILKLYARDAEVVQNLIQVSSYKKHYLPTGTLLPDTRIVSFHGKPRPHEIAEKDKPKWMKENWIC